ncbi:hypothetical protein SEUCBS140593_007485 [Sporothrix eucalyptigena]|uniref:Uncharacterized protein n=1 Tax=Sporothrix eucalyptigena TaxID=1812306 RepID=A0ABP0CDL7_9PEZI
MTDNQQGQGGLDLNLDPNAISTMHIKTIKEAAKLADYLPLRWDELSKVPFYAKLFGYSDDWYRASVAMAVLGIRSRAQRVLTQEEMQAIAGMSARLSTRMSYEFPVMLGTALFLERRTRATFGFPFYKPSEAKGFTPNSFPTASSPILKGSQARMAWHALRFSLYTAVSHFGLRMVFFAWATSLNTLEFESNPKLADLRETLKVSVGQWKDAKKKAALEEERSNGRQQFGGMRPREEGQDEPSAAPSGLRESVLFGRRALQQQPSQALPQPQEQQQEQQWSQPEQQQPQSQNYADYSNDYSNDFSSDQDDFNDASPVAPSARREAPTRPTGGPGASWERLRHPGAAGQKPVAISQAPQGQYGWEALRNGQAPPQQPKPAPPVDSRQTTGDYTISSADEEKAYAQNQAQKDFDAMLERERKGESESSRRW